MEKSKIVFVATILLLTMMMCSCADKTGNQNQQLVKNYYQAYEQKDWHLLQSILSPAFTFSSPMDAQISLNAYHQRCWPNAQNTKRFDIKKLVLGDNEAFVTYNGFTNDGRTFCNTEYFKFADGKITENDCFFGPGVSFPNNKK